MKRAVVLIGPALLALGFVQDVGAVAHRTQPKKTANGNGKNEPRKVSRLVPSPRFQRISVDAGLPQLSVYSIAQDPAGFMWFGTGEGLARFDGYKFRVFQADPSSPRPTISNNSVTALLDDGKGALWIGTHEGGLNRFEYATETFTVFKSDDKDPRSLSSDSVTSIFRDKSGVIWIGTDKGLNKLDAAGKKFTRFRSDPEASNTLPGDAVNSIHEGPLGLWIATGNGLARYDSAADSFVRFRHKDDDPESLVTNDVSTVHVDKTGTVWVGTNGGGLDALDPKTKKFVHYRHSPDDPESLSDDTVLVVYEDRSGALWIGTHGHLNQLDKKTGKFKRFLYEQNDPSTLPYPIVASLFEDQGGVLWVGTWGGGVGKLDLAGARIPLFKSGSPFCFYDEGTVLWIGEQVGGLARFDRKSGAMKYYRAEPQETVSIHAIHRDAHGNLWLGTYGKGLRRFDPVTETFETFETSQSESGHISNNIVLSVHQAKDGTMWIGTFGGGLNKFDPKAKWFTAYAADPYDRQALSSDYIHTIVPSRTEKNILWIGTGEGGGLNRFDPETETFTHYKNEPNNPESLSNDNVLSIYEDDDGLFWLGTYGGGLNRFDPKKTSFKHYTVKDGLPQNFVFGILPDDEGNLWLSTNKGISRFNKKTEVFTNFDVNDGLQGSEFNEGAFHKGQTGEMFFGGPNGFNAFFPKDLKLDPFVPPIVLTELLVANKDFDLGRPLTRGVAEKELEEIKLKYDQAFLSFGFSALSFSAPEKNRYQYRLDGLHDWTEVGADRRFVSYTLQPGTYTFRVKGSNRHHVWNQEGISVKLRIMPPPWRTWWAYSIYGLVALGLALSYLRWQEARVERLKQAARLQTVEKDLDGAAMAQSWFLPEKPRLVGRKCELAGFCRPADRCSGDWWWYDWLDEGSLWVVVGDVTGHGAGPAVVTAAVATALRVQKQTAYGMPCADGFRIPERLAGVNDQLRAICSGKYHMTTTSLEVDEASGKVTIYGTGGLPAFCVKKEGKATTVGVWGTPLGAHPFEVGRIDYTLSPGERMMICTDGIPEAMMPNGSMIGLRRARGFLESTRHLPLQAAVQAIVAAVDQARGPTPQEDDFTFVLLDWGNSSR